MTEISRVALFGKLNTLAYQSIESATVFCKMRGNPYVELAHWLHQILQGQDSDLHRIIRHYDLDPGRIATEITREQLYRQLHEELPYDSAVRPEKYVERKDGSVEIHQQIVVMRDNQRAIVLGKGGSRIKEIGQAAREELSELLGRKVHLFLHVKTDERWSEDKEMFEEIGLDWKS